MKKRPLVSIITPTYNHARFIGQCIESVLAQTYPNWEQIIINDGSTDRTGDIVAQYKDDRIKYTKQDNVGIWRLGETYNKALRCSQGEFIAILEGDDYWPPYKLERQLPAFVREGVVISWGKAAITNSKGEMIAIRPKSIKWFRNRSKEEILRRLLFGNFIKSSTVVCRKDALLSIGGFKQPEYVPYVDYPTFLELGLLGEFLVIDEILGYWRRYREQVTMTVMREIPDFKKVSIDFFRQIPQELKNSLGVSIDELLAAHQHGIATALFTSGRIDLTEKKWGEAWRSFREALAKGSLMIKLGALLGLLCARCKVDLEWAATIMRSPSVKY